MPLLNILTQALPYFKPFTGSNTEGSGWVKESMFCSNGEEIYWYVTTHSNRFAFKRINYSWLEEYAGMILESPRIYVTWNDKHRIWSWLTLQDKGEPRNLLSDKARRGNEIKKLKS